LAVGKGSIQRVKVAANVAAEEPKKENAEVKEVEAAPVKKASAPKKETATKKAPAKKTVAKPKTANAKKDDIHEKKFEAIDGIYTTLPTYLL